MTEDVLKPHHLCGPGELSDMLCEGVCTAGAIYAQFAHATWPVRYLCAGNAATVAC